MLRRSCVVCRESADKHQLLRFVLRDDRSGAAASDSPVVCDSLGKMSGRGAYCHNDSRCLRDTALIEKLHASLKRNKTRGQARPIRSPRMSRGGLLLWAGERAGRNCPGAMLLEEAAKALDEGATVSGSAVAGMRGTKLGGSANIAARKRIEEALKRLRSP